MDENIVFEERKLKRKGVIHACFKKDGVARIKVGLSPSKKMFVCFQDSPSKMLPP